MAVLSRLYATNYRCLVNFEFKPTTKQLIIGRNGTGKTAVLDVLAMLRDFAVRGKPCEGMAIRPALLSNKKVSTSTAPLCFASKKVSLGYSISRNLP